MFPLGEFDAISKPLQSSFRQKMIKHYYSDTRLKLMEVMKFAKWLHKGFKSLSASFDNVGMNQNDHLVVIRTSKDAHETFV